MRRFSAVLFVVSFAALSLASLATVVQAQAPALAVPPNTTVMASHEPITITISLKNGHASLTPTLISSDSITLPARLKLIGSAFTLDPMAPVNAPPMIIEVRYTTPGAIDEKRLTLVYYDALAEKWRPLETTLDTAQHVATAEMAAPDTVYALVMSPEAVSLPFSAVIVDDLDSTHFARYGASAGWHEVTGPTNHYYLGHMYWTSNTFSILDNYAIWTPPALNPGPYQVWAFVAWDNATTRQARYQIVHNGQTTI
jgi:hypothetical protein